MSRQSKLLDVHAHLNAAIRETETWEASYTSSPSTFKRLVMEESLLQSSANGYLLGLSQRVPMIVNWSEIKFKPLQAAAVPPESDDAWKNELTLMYSAVYAHVLELMVIGANAGEDLYKVPLGINTFDEFILNAADKYTAGLVSGVTSTTRRYIQQSIKTSIQLGEDATAAVERIQKRVSNSVRAEMIAQTESVTAYQTGIDHFAVESGGISSTWDALLGACSLCSPVSGTTVLLGQHFTLGNGHEVQFPPGHVKCRCGRIINYS